MCTNKNVSVISFSPLVLDTLSNNTKKQFLDFVESMSSSVLANISKKSGLDVE